MAYPRALKSVRAGRIMVRFRKLNPQPFVMEIQIAAETAAIRIVTIAAFLRASPLSQSLL